MTAPLSATYEPGRPVPLRAILGGLRRGAGDPTWREDHTGLWRACHTPSGPVTLNLRATVGGVAATAYGDGAQWVLDQLPALLGADDDPSGFVAHHQVIAEAVAAQPHWRIGRTGLVMDALVPAILEQRVTGKQAFGGYRLLVHRFGSRAPGPRTDLMLPPTVHQWAMIPSWQWLKAGVDAQRSDTVMRAVRVAARLEECVQLPAQQARQRLCAVPGIGVWTAAEVAQRALGDADAVSFGDYHVAKDIGYALTGTPVDDTALAHLLKPYAGHRYRVQYLVASGGLRRPRRGPRLTLPTHLPR